MPLFSDILALTLTTRGIGFTEQNCVFFSQNSNISQVISGITKPIPGMFVLIWMPFSWWIQLLSRDSTMLKKLQLFLNFLTCRLHSPATWKALNLITAFTLTLHPELDSSYIMTSLSCATVRDISGLSFIRQNVTHHILSFVVSYVFFF